MAPPKASSVKSEGGAAPPNCTIYEVHRNVTIDQDTTCLDLMLPNCFQCQPCHAFRMVFMKGETGGFNDADCPDDWPRYSAKRKVTEEAESAKNMEDAKKLFDYCDEVTKAFQA